LYLGNKNKSRKSPFHQHKLCLDDDDDFDISWALRESSSYQDIKAEANYRRKWKILGEKLRIRFQFNKKLHNCLVQPFVVQNCQIETAYLLFI